MKGNKKIKLDVVIPIPCRVIYVCYLHFGHELGAIAAGNGTKMSIQCVHEILSYCDEETKRKIAKHLGCSIKHHSITPVKDVQMKMQNKKCH